MANDYIKQHHALAMGMSVDGQKLPPESKNGGNIEVTKGTKGDPKATPALISEGKKNA